MKILTVLLGATLFFSLLATAQASTVYYSGSGSYYRVPSYGHRTYKYPAYAYNYPVHTYGDYYHLGINTGDFRFSGSYYNYRPYYNYGYCGCYYYVNGHRFCC
jgi:hypothetical protein